ACLLALAGIFEIGKAHLAHGRLGSGGQAYFITCGNLFGESLEITETRVVTFLLNLKWKYALRKKQNPLCYRISPDEQPINTTAD
ncbi:MAG: hypothetical protein KID05_06055, partial [Pseudomonas sp.]|uniref:hypothetical protein n=1 Tax=Pseudomonas sp. TaxID=306 RepID=UPI0023542E9E